MKKPQAVLVGLSVTTVVAASSAALAGPASAASIWVTANGSNLANSTQSAASITVQTSTDWKADRITYGINGTQVGADTTIDHVGSLYVGSSVVSLKGLTGSVQLTTTLYSGTSRLVNYKTFKVATTGGASTTPTPVPTPTTTATSTATATPAPSSTTPPVVPSGFPGGSDTGFNPKSSLTPVTSKLVVTVDGTVVDGEDISAPVVINANNVTVRNSRVRVANSQFVIRLGSGYTGLTVQDSEIDGLGTSEMPVCCGDYTLLRDNIHDTIDGPRLGGNVLIQDSWIHNMRRVGTFHSDAMQSTSGTNIVIRHNTLDPRDLSTNDLQNSAIMLGSETAPNLLSDVLVEDNFLNGGNFTVNVRGDINAVNVQFHDNVFGPNSRYGAMTAPAGIVVDASNILQSTGLPIVVKPA